MRILFLSALYPYPITSGGHVRLVNLLKRLSLKHEIHLVSFTRSTPSYRDRTQVSALCKDSHEVIRGKVWQLKYIFKAIISSMSLLQSSYIYEDSRSIVRKLLYSLSFDVIHVEPMYLAQLIPEEYMHKCVFVEHNIEYMVYQNYINRYRMIYPLYKFLQHDVNKLLRSETLLWQKPSRIVAVSGEDKKIIEESSLRSDVRVVNNAVSIDEVEYNEKNRSRNQIIFVGYFGWFPNLVAVKELIRNIWPYIHAQLPELKLTIIGKNLPLYLQKEANRIEIEVKGWVSDIGEYYRSATALIAPFSIGGGTKFKILEAMAYGCPVIGTETAFSGIEIDFKKHGLKVNTLNEYIEALKLVLHNESQRRQITKEARKLIETNYSWDRSAAELEKIWKSV